MTRPAHQAEGLCQLLINEGLIPWRFPTLAIVGFEHEFSSVLFQQTLASYNLIVFISQNAAEWGISKLVKAGGISTQTKIATVGETTSHAIRQLGFTVDLQPEQDFSSSGLLAMPALQNVAGWRILIVRGEGGRELLAEVFQQRGAQVDSWPVYRRILPEIDPEPTLSALKENRIHIIIATSIAILENLQTSLASFPEAWVTLNRLPLVVVSERVEQWASRSGWQGKIQIAASARDHDLMEGIKRSVSVLQQ